MVPPPAGPCPRCGVALRPAEVGGCAMHGCMRCGALWLDFVSTGKVMSCMHAGALEAAERATQGAQVGVDTTAADLPCPVCHQPMKRMHVGGTTVEVDRCDDHGTFFDCDELRQAAEQVAARRGSHAAGAPAAIAAASAGEYSLSADPRFSGVFGDDGDDDDYDSGGGGGIALAGAFVLFEVLLDVFMDS